MRSALFFNRLVWLATGFSLAVAGNSAAAGCALAFDGTNDYVTIETGLFPTVTNTFTMELWANPVAARTATVEGVAGYPGTGGQRYAVFPEYGAGAYGSDSHAGAGISIGTNGASVFEHSGAYLPSPLVYTGSLAGWTHFAVTYSNGLPRLYVGGSLVRTGLVSGRLVHPSVNLGESGRGYGYFRGKLDEVRVWNVALDEATIQAWLGRELNSSHPAYSELIGYWRLNEGGGADAIDASSGGHNGGLQNGPTWVAPGSPLAGPVAPGAFGPSATELTDTAVVLNGSANPQGQVAMVWFDWGTSTNYEFTTSPQELAAGEGLVPVASGIAGLSPLTTYHFRMVISNSAAVFRTVGSSFRTLGPPVAVTLPMTNASFASAVLPGTVNPNGHTTWAWFEWGTTANYGMVTDTQSVGSSTNTSFVSAAISGLISGGQQYHYRLVATNSSGVSIGQQRSFSTRVFSPAGTLPEAANEGRLYWCDYDNDEWMDLLVLRTWGTNGTTILYHNATGALSAALIQFPIARLGGADWGDYDADGQLDIVLSSEAHWQPAARVFRNNKGTFTDIGVRLPSLHYSSAAWGDFDNDGDLDLLLCGSSSWSDSGGITRIYRNEDGSFTDIGAGLAGAANGDAAWGDFDNDGDLDLLVMGTTTGGYVTRVYRNTNGVFSDVATGMPGVVNGSGAWGDFDNDGDLDILLTGTTDTGMALARVYRNDHGTFVDAYKGLIPVLGDKAAWADFDNDGRLDVILGGRVYRNEGSVLVELGTAIGAESPLYPASSDFDNDGRMDFGVIVSAPASGWQGGLQETVRLYRSLLQSPHSQIPQPPTGLTATVVSNSVRLAWLTPEGTESPTNGLTYNVRLLGWPGDRRIVPSHSEPITGRRLLPRMGNAQCRLFSTFTNLPLGTYYWSVQSVNGSFIGSPWANEQFFIVTNGVSLYGTLPASNVLCCSAVLNGVVTLRAVATSAWFEWGTTTNLGVVTPIQELGTGLLPVLVTHPLSALQPLTSYFFRLVSSNSSEVTFGETRGFTTELPVPAPATLSLTNLTSTTAMLLGALPAGSAPATHFVEWGLTANYGQSAPLNYLNAALSFDGADDCVLVVPGRFTDIASNFTMELWVNPSASRLETAESVAGTAGMRGQRYAVFPEFVSGIYDGRVHAGAGLSVGLNGVAVVEHAGDYVPTVLVLSNQVSGWFHLALTYSNGLPRLYLNGSLARVGLASGHIIHPSAFLGGDGSRPYGSYAGAIRDVRIWNVPLDASTIGTWMNRTVTEQHPAFANLQGFWLLDEGQGLTTEDLSARGNKGHLVNGPTWKAGWQSEAFVFSAALIGLTPGTEYHFRSVASNNGGTAYGPDETLTTSSRPLVMGITMQTAPATAGSLLRFLGSPRAGYVLEASTNLVDWLALTELVAGPDGLCEFLDTGATNSSTRFYRLKVP